MKILAIGEIIWDVYPDKKVIGGAPLNFSAHAVLCGAESTLISAIGKDFLGDAAIQALREFGVDDRYVQKNDCSTGQCIVELDENAVPQYHVLREVSYDKILLQDDDLRKLEQEKFDALYFGTLIQRDAVSRKAVRDLVQKCHFRHVVCDVNLRPDCYDSESIAFCLQNATILKVSFEEEPLLRACARYMPTESTPKSIAQALCEAYLQLEVVIITLGKDGSYSYCARAQSEYYQKAIGDKVVSTVGAGDSFAAAWLTSYLNHQPMEQCMKYAAQISGIVVANLQAVPKDALQSI